METISVTLICCITSVGTCWTSVDAEEKSNETAEKDKSIKRKNEAELIRRRFWCQILYFSYDFWRHSEEDPVINALMQIAQH